ncbi:MAG: hypothetical protein FIB01_08210 [Gemmatimonadetes bacterium]|nr:hypothetical protein [Gemmatimonadota bacterium]
MSNLVPFSFDLSSLVPRSVASLYSHLVTRPTGQALRVGIESQLAELGSGCISVLDFTQVAVLDYSCADEAVAKLIKRFQPRDRPAEAYFLARGVAEQHREPLEEVLARHGLVLAADVAGMGYTLLGAPSMLEQLSWAALQQAGSATAREVAAVVHKDESEVASALDSLAYRRAVVPGEAPGSYYALSALLS